MAEEQIGSEEGEAARFRQWFLEAVQHPVWECYIREAEGGKNNQRGEVSL